VRLYIDMLSSSFCKALDRLMGGELQNYHCSLTGLPKTCRANMNELQG